jgi:hypothetical protein
MTRTPKVWKRRKNRKNEIDKDTSSDMGCSGDETQLN